MAITAKCLLTRKAKSADNRDMGFRIAQLADLARQLEFTPRDKRGAQIAAAEELLLQIDPAKAYPFDFVLFRITGYHVKRVGSAAIADAEFAGQLLTGLALQHDLGLLIEQVSDGMNVGVADLNEPVFTIEQICQQFNVSEKSIQRWRRKGLAARRFIFADGIRRIGFLAGSVEKFFAIHRDGVAHTANCAPISEEERRQITKRATCLMDTGFWADEITRRIGRRMNRSPMMVSHILNSNLSWATTAPDSSERARIAADFRRGVSLREMALRFVRPRAAIYRILLEQRLENLVRCTVRFIDDPLYHQPDAARVIADIAGARDVTEQSGPQESRVPSGLPPYLQSLYGNPLLTAQRERALFLKMHFHRFQFCLLRHALEAPRVRWHDLDRLEAHLNQAMEAKNELVAANLRLVVSVARKHVRGTATLMDLISDGNIVIMRAVDAYDLHRGNRFSTYATLALMKEHARAERKTRRRHELVVEVADARGMQDGRRIDVRDEVQQLLSSLPERDQTVLRARFGLSDERRSQPASPRDVGRQLGLSTQLIRRIEKNALAKLRENVEL